MSLEVFFNKLPKNKYLLFYYKLFMIKVKEEKLAGSICESSMLLIHKLGKDIINKGNYRTVPIWT